MNLLKISVSAGLTAVTALGAWAAPGAGTFTRPGVPMVPVPQRTRRHRRAVVPPRAVTNSRRSAVANARLTQLRNRRGIIMLDNRPLPAVAFRQRHRASRAYALRRAHALNRQERIYRARHARAVWRQETLTRARHARALRRERKIYRARHARAVRRERKIYRARHARAVRQERRLERIRRLRALRRGY